MRERTEGKEQRKTQRRLCEILGIGEKPILIKDRKQMHAILVNAGKPKRCAGWGQCFWDLNTIFVDTGAYTIQVGDTKVSQDQQGRL